MFSQKRLFKLYSGKSSDDLCLIFCLYPSSMLCNNNYCIYSSYEKCKLIEKKMLRLYDSRIYEQQHTSVAQEVKMLFSKF